MVNKLKPCPFCGEEGRIIIKTEGTFSDFGLYRSMVRCAECGVIVDRYEKTPYAAEDRAIEAWNTRAERTCRMVKPDWGGPKCRDKVCSECGVLFQTWGEKYCSHCGAKVVK